MIIGKALTPLTNATPGRSRRASQASPTVRVVEPAEILLPVEAVRPLDTHWARGSGVTRQDLGQPRRGRFIDLLV